MTEEQSLAAAIAEEIALVPYDASWPDIFAAERDRLMSMFAEELIEVQHIGSTAVPGLQAKPVIDILAGVQSMAVADALVKRLCCSGYTTSAEFNATLPLRRWLMRWADGHRTHHLHLVIHGGREWLEHLQFRDKLRSNPQLAHRYSEFKSHLAAKHRTDREAYTNAKSEFVRSVAGDA